MKRLQSKVYREKKTKNLHMRINNISTELQFHRSFFFLLPKKRWLENVRITWFTGIRGLAYYVWNLFEWVPFKAMEFFPSGNAYSSDFNITCGKKLDATQRDWCKALFTNKSRFSLKRDTRCVLVWKYDSK